MTGVFGRKGIDGATARKAVTRRPTTSHSRSESSSPWRSNIGRVPGSMSEVEVNEGLGARLRHEGQVADHQEGDADPDGGPVPEAGGRLAAGLQELVGPHQRDGDQQE